MGWTSWNGRCGMKIRAKNGGQTVDITLPATDMDMQYCMKCIGIEDIVPVCCISEVWDEPSYFGFLKGQTVSMDELNFLARRLDGMTEYEKRVVGVYSSETGIREMKQLINLTYSLQGLSLLTDLTDGNRVGLRLYLDRHLAISEEEKSKMDFNAYAQKIFSEGKCKFLPHGILVDQGFQLTDGKSDPGGAFVCGTGTVQDHLRRAGAVKYHAFFRFCMPGRHFDGDSG